MDKVENNQKTNLVRTRHLVHLAFSVGMFVVILVFNAINDSSVVGMIFRVASYTYGPLLGLYAFGLFLKSKKVNDRLVPIICILSPALTFIINENSVNLLGGYVFDNELIIVNTLITFIGLLLTSKTVANKYQF
jgi:hypothetical protein